MGNPQKRRGDRAEREAAELLHTLLGYPTRRKLGAGRQDDTGDIDGIPNLTIQVADWAATARAAVEKPPAASVQAANAGTRHAITMVRFRGGKWRVVLTPEQFAELWLEVVS
jgi:hypothetical protein